MRHSDRQKFEVESPLSSPASSQFSTSTVKPLIAMAAPGPHMPSYDRAPSYNRAPPVVDRRSRGQPADSVARHKRRWLFGGNTLEEGRLKEGGMVLEHGKETMTLGNEALRGYSCTIVGGEAAREQPQEQSQTSRITGLIKAVV